MGDDDRTFRANFSSEGVSALREVVKEKLKEFMGDYTDDTLVEYVIVLLKNGRSKGEARNELDVFLGDDSDPFISWLWDHLESNLSLYIQPEELHAEGVPKTESASDNQPGKTGSHKIESGTDKGNSIKTERHHHNRGYKGLLRDPDEEVSVPRKSVANSENAMDENQLRDSQTKPSHSPQSTIRKKRRRNDEVQQPRKREASKLNVSAPKRLLQFAVRDAVATSRPSNPTADPSYKRLRSVVATTTDAYSEERPQRIHRASMSVAIKAMAEAVKDVTKVRPSRNVFDRLGNATDNPNAEYGGVADVEMENPYDSSGLQERNLDTDGYDEVALRRGQAMDGGNWVESSLNFQYDGIPNRPHKDMGQPAGTHNAILRNSSSITMGTRKPHYQEEMLAAEMDNRQIMRGIDTVSTKSEAWLMKENNISTVGFNGNAKPDATLHESEKTLMPSGLRNTGPPTEDADSRTIFVSNVHFASTKDSLSRHFNKFGEVLKVIILTDPSTGQPKGSAYIEFMRKEAAELALSLDGTSFMSRILKIVKKRCGEVDGAAASSVVMAWPPPPRASPFVVPRFSRAGGFGRGRGGRVGARSYQWKRGGPAHETNPTNPSRSLTYVRPESKTNGTTSSGTAA